jgi:methane/ammonia monooxygenase subunit A
MTVEALEIPTKPYTGEKARLSRAYDYLILVLALFLLIGAFHLHVALTAGDWDFWVDWKDRQWWPLVTPLMMITFPAAVQSLLWSNFRLPMGATLCISCLLIGSWIARIFAIDHHQHLRGNCVRVAVLSEQLADFRHVSCAG